MTPACRTPNGEGVHLAAHSMGNRVLVLGLADFPPPKVPLGQVVLIAADVEAVSFEQKFPKMAGGGGPVTSYASQTDRALFVSSWFHKARRVGFIGEEPIHLDGMETIDAAHVDTGLLGHGYFGDERSVLTDLGLLLREGLPAGRRRLRLAPGGRWWVFPR